MKYEKLIARWPEYTHNVLTNLPKRRKSKTVYGSETPVPSLLSRAWQATKNAAKSQWQDEDNRIEALAILGVCVIVGLCLFTLLQVMPGAIDGLMEHQRQIVAESTK